MQTQRAHPNQTLCRLVPFLPQALSEANVGVGRLEAFLALENRLRRFPHTKDPNNEVEVENCTCAWSTPVKAESSNGSGNSGKKCIKTLLLFYS